MQHILVREANPLTRVSLMTSIQEHSRMMHLSSAGQNIAATANTSIKPLLRIRHDIERNTEPRAHYLASEIQRIEDVSRDNFFLTPSAEDDLWSIRLAHSIVEGSPHMVPVTPWEVTMRATDVGSLGLKGFAVKGISLLGGTIAGSLKTIGPLIRLEKAGAAGTIATVRALETTVAKQSLKGPTIWVESAPTSSLPLFPELEVAVRPTKVPLWDIRTSGSSHVSTVFQEAAPIRGPTSASQQLSLFEAEPSYVMQGLEVSVSGQSQRVLLENQRSSIHSNSNAYVGDTHVYIIRDAEGNIWKIGESMQGISKFGQSKRARAQTNQLRRETGRDYDTEIRCTFPTKLEARQYETSLIERYRSMFGNDLLPGNKGNR